MVTNPFDLSHAFSAKQAQLKASLEATSVVAHPGDKGDISEDAWMQFLKQLLPQRYEVSKATVVDCRGGMSQAIDVVVHDRHFSPLVFWEADVLYVPAESVYAVFECKPTMDKAYLEYAGEKAGSVRSLHRTSATIVHAGGTIDTPKPPPAILAGFLASRSSWRPAFGDPFRQCLRTTGAERLDLGCLVEGGAWELSLEDGASAQTVPGTQSLIFFAVRLMARLQRMGSVPAMDYDEWSQPFWARPTKDPRDLAGSQG
jgi:hypothetical protein